MVVEMRMLNYLREVLKTPEYSDEYPNDYFEVNIQIMKTATIWDRKKPFSIFIFIYCIIYCTPSEFISLWYTRINVASLTMNLGVALTHGVAVIKVMNWYYRQQDMVDLMSSLQEREDLKYENYKSFKPGYIIQKAKRLNIVVSTLFFWCAISVPVSGYIAGFANIFINYFWHHSTVNLANSTDNNNSTISTTNFKCGLPFFSWIPFDYSTAEFCFLAMMFQSVPMYYLTLMIVAVDTFFMSLVNFLTSHLMVLQGALKTVCERGDVKAGSNVNILIRRKNELNELKKCLKHLQFIQNKCEDVENAYSLQMLCQVMVSLFVICTCLFLISTEPIMGKTFIVEVIYVLALEYQLTLYCWFGNELTLASIGVADALYESNWLAAGSDLKRCILITMIRCKKPIYLTVGKFTPLTVQTLQAILRGSYSLYAVLKNRNTDE